MSFTTPNLVVRFLMWRERLVHPHPRSVLKSAQLLNNPVYIARRDDIHHIFAKVAIGQDIGPHLSRNVKFGYDRPLKGKKGGRDIDGLLNEWGVHHLHLSQTLEPDGHVKRGSEVLAVIFRQDRAYFLDILRHGEWSEQRIVAAAVQNWPDQKLFVELRGMLPGKMDSSEETAQLRAASVNTWVEIDGRCYIASTGGISTALTPARATVWTNHLLRQLMAIEADPQILLPGFRKTPGFESKMWPKRPRYRVKAAITAENFSFVIREEKTGLAHALSI
jgi:hypothetical protein